MREQPYARPWSWRKLIDTQHESTLNLSTFRVLRRPFQINGLATEGMVCKFVLQWYRRFEHRVFAEDRKAESLGYGGASGETILAERMAVASNFSRLEEFTRR